MHGACVLYAGVCFFARLTLMQSRRSRAYAIETQTGHVCIIELIAIQIAITEAASFLPPL